ncbi:MAG: restriction endonuclease, partial [Clostridia bacterium]
MEFYSDEHKAKIARLEKLWENLHELADMCKEYGIQDMLQDNGLKVMQQLVYLNMDFLPGREGNDSISNSGTEWEMKSVNIL